jgi:hypothetical protein
LAEQHTQNEVKLSGEEHAIQALSRVKEFGYAAWMPGWVSISSIPLLNKIPLIGAIPFPVSIAWFFGGIAGVLATGASKLGWEGARSGLSSVQSALEMVVTGATKVINEVSLNQLHQAPAVFLKEAGVEVARRNNGLAKVAPAHLNEWGNAAAKTMNEAVAKAAKPVGKVVGAIDNVANAGGASSLNSMVGNVFNARHGRVVEQASNRILSAEASFSYAPRSFWQRLTRQAPVAAAVSQEVTAALTPALGHVKSAMDVSGKEAVAALQKAAVELGMLAEKGAPEIANHAASAGQAVNKALASASKAVHLENVANGGVAAWLKSAANSVGNMKLRTAIIGTAVLAGSAIAFLSARVQGKKEVAALADFKTDAGADSALAKAAEHSVKSGALGRYVGAGVSSAADSMMLSHDPMRLIMPQMALSMAAGQFGGSSKLLAAHQALKDNESGKAPLEPMAKFEAVKLLVAAVPAVEAAGGEYNRLTKPVAASIVEKNMSVKETMHLLNDAPAFNAFATEVKAKMEAAAKPAANVQVPQTKMSAPAAPIEAAKPAAVASPADKTAVSPHHAAVPMAAVSNTAYEGKVVAQQRAVAS